MSAPSIRSALRRDWPLYVVVAATFGLALFWPPGGVHEAHRFEFDDSSSPWIVSGWSNPERMSRGVDFTWAVGEVALLRLPVEGRRDRMIVLRCWPYSVPDATQTLTVSLNGTRLTRLQLEDRIATYPIFVPAHAFRPPGEDDVLLLEFDHARSPADGSDSRRLAVAFDWIRIRDWER